MNSVIPVGPRSLTPAPIVLAIETAGSACSAAVSRGAEILAHERRPLRHGHAEALMPMVERVTAASGASPSELQIVAAATGPGGFTGIRVGLAAAQGIALASGARLVGVSSFAAVAAAIASATIGDFRALLIALDSRRADLYLQPFAPDGATRLREAAAILPAGLAAYVADLVGDGAVLIAGDAAETAVAVLGVHPRIGLVPNSAPDALGVAAAALRELRPGDPPEAVRPFYLRPPDVTLPKGRGSGAGRRA